MSKLFIYTLRYYDKRDKQLGKEKTEKIIFIRCSDTTFDTRKRFKKLMIEHDFSDYEEILQTLIRMGENHPEWVKKGMIRNV